VNTGARETQFRENPLTKSLSQLRIIATCRIGESRPIDTGNAPGEELRSALHPGADSDLTEPPRAIPGSDEVAPESNCQGILIPQSDRKMRSRMGI